MKTANSDCSDVCLFMVDGDYFYWISSRRLLLLLLFVFILAEKNIKILFL